MTLTRRQFMRQFGIILASLVLGGCCTPATSISPGGKIGRARERLREYWLRLGDLRQEIGADSTYDVARIAQLIADHRVPLDELVAAGGLSVEAAEQVQGMFDAAARYVWDQSQITYTTCYIPLEPNLLLVPPTPQPPEAEAAEHKLASYVKGSTERLAQQALLMADLAEQEDMDSETLARTQAAIQRDMALLCLPDQEAQRLQEWMTKSACVPCRRAYSFPPLEALDLEVPPEIAEAACFLIELLLGKCEPVGLTATQSDLSLACRKSDHLLSNLHELWLLLLASSDQSESTDLEPVSYETAEQWQDQVLWHQEMLDLLVHEKTAADAETEAAANRFQDAYATAVERVLCSQASDAVCSLPALAAAYALISAQQITEQIGCLIEVATSCECDWAAVTQAQAAVEQSLAFLMLADEEVRTLCEALDDVGENLENISLADLDLEITQEAAGTAQFLVDLILREENVSRSS